MVDSPCRYLALGGLLLAALLLQPVQAWAWGASGHRLISRMAVEELPAEIPVFLRTRRVAEMVGELGREPDRGKGTGQSHDHDLDPGHYLNLADDLTVAGGPPLAPLPATREAYDSALRAAGSNEYRAGYLPYALVDGWQQLMRDFAYWRADRAAWRRSPPGAARNWLGRDLRLRQLLILRDLGYWSHFVADASQPMHVSVHYDQWGDFPNPNQYAVSKGFHARFEGAFVAGLIRPADVRARLAPPRDCQCSIQQRTVDYLLTTRARVDRLFELESAGAFAAGSAEARAFAAERLAAGVGELRDLIVLAWRASADATVGYPPLPVRAVEAGQVYPLRELQGLD